MIISLLVVGIFRGSLAYFLRENGQNSCRLKFQGFNNKVKASIAMAQQRLDVWCDRLALVGVDVVDSQLYGSDFFSVFVRDFAAESFFQAITSSTVSRESAPKSSWKEDSFFTSASFTPSCSATIFFNLLFDV